MHHTEQVHGTSRRAARWLAVLIALTFSCVSSSVNRAGVEEPNEGSHEDESPPAVVVSSIDPPLPTPGPELRLARVELSREEISILGGFIAVALTGDPGALETLIRGLGDRESCQEAAVALVFLPRRLAARPLWLALRLDCSADIARDVAPLLDLEHLVESALQDGDLRDRTESSEPDDNNDDLPSTDNARCDAVASALRALSRGEGQLSGELQSLSQATWEIPAEDTDLCSDPVLAAAVRLHSQDRGVQLAFDLSLDTPGLLPNHVVSFINRFGLGGVTPRLEDRIEEADGAICAAIVRAGEVEAALDILIESPLDVPRCLYPAARALRRAEDEDSQEALAAIAAIADEEGAGEAALTAAIALLDRGERPPPWAADAAILGRGLGAILSRRLERSRPTGPELRHFKRSVARLHPRRDPPPEEGPVRLYQRDIRTVLDMASGPRRSALRLLLEAGTR